MLALFAREVQHYLPSEADEVAGLVSDLVGFVIPEREPEMQQPGADADESCWCTYRLLQAVAREPMLLVVVHAT